MEGAQSRADAKDKLASQSNQPVGQSLSQNQSSLATSHPATDMVINVAVVSSASRLTIATSTTGIIKNDSGRGLRSLPAGVGYSLQNLGEAIDFGSWKSPRSIWIEPTPGGYVFVANHWYRGKVRLIAQENGLLAVNQVKLEEYLYSVVGSEMWSEWPIEALKAQAVAARSYALARYLEAPSPFYHLGATEAWQVYKGLDGEAASTRAAVVQTLGQVLTDKGAIVDALYASTDEVTAKAHKGVGMSQEGARDLAKQGQDYLHILQFYYPGTTLSRLQLTPPKH